MLVLIRTLKTMIENQFGPGSVLLLAPTGVAAVNIQGATIHSQFYIPKNIAEFGPLKGAAARQFSNRMRNVKYLILDKFSMVGLNMLGMIEQRCRQATGKQEYFGGLHVFMFGDLKQLPPVLDTPLYSSSIPKQSIGIHGKVAFNSFQKSITLSQVLRQEDETFKGILDHISSGKITQDDYNILQQRFTYNVPKQEKGSFKSAIKLFGTKEEVKNVNMSSISNLKCSLTQRPVSIARISAKHNCNAASTSSLDDANGLAPVLYLGKGMKIMLKANLWTDQGLVNGSVGTVVDIVYAKDSKPPEDSPIAIVCTFNSYKGPYLNNATMSKLVSIPSVTSTWTSKDGESCSRTQFPLTLAYACSIHKSQGLTLEKAIIDIGKREISIGLSYVALSRVRKLTDLILEPFPLSRLLKINNSPALKQKLQAEEEINKKC